MTFGRAPGLNRKQYRGKFPHDFFMFVSEINKQLLSNYENLDEDIKTDIPIKRVWTVANPND